MIVLGYIISILYVLLCVGGAMLLSVFRVPKKYTRKFVHILVGFEWVILYHFFGASVHFFAVCVLFTLLLFIDYKAKLLPAMSSDGDNAPGTVYYALAMTILSFASLFAGEIILPFGIAVFCTSLGDGFAGVVGQAVRAHNPKIYGSKSLFGTVTNFAVCLIATATFSAIFNYPLEIWHCLAIAIFATEIELFVSRGLDNLILTISVAALAYFFVYIPGTSDYILPILLTPLIIALSYTKRALTIGGIILAVVMDLFVSISLKNFGFAVLTAFFAGSVVIDKIKKRRKNTEQNKDYDIEKRGECRDVVQVFANGAVALVAAICYLITQNRLFIVAFVSSLAEAFADTTASGVGIFSKKTYDLFRGKRCDRGISGGVSLIGTFSSLIASFLIALVAFAFSKITVTELLIITAAGFFGCLFDSMLGSLVQVKYKCGVCGKITEREEHCGVRAQRYRGLLFIDNDVVNLLGTIFAAAFSVIIYVSFM